MLPKAALEKLTLVTPDPVFTRYDAGVIAA